MKVFKTMTNTGGHHFDNSAWLIIPTPTGLLGLSFLPWGLVHRSQTSCTTPAVPTRLGGDAYKGGADHIDIPICLRVNWQTGMTHICYDDPGWQGQPVRAPQAPRISENRVALIQPFLTPRVGVGSGPPHMSSTFSQAPSVPRGFEVNQNVGRPPGDFMLSPLPRYDPLHDARTPPAAVVPSGNAGAPASEPQTNPVARANLTTVLQATVDNSRSSVNDDGAEVDLAGFSFNFRIYTLCANKNKKKKATWKPIQDRNVTLPAGSSFAGLDLKAFKKLIAGSCKHGRQSAMNAVLKCERDGVLTWLFHVNKSHAFLRVNNIKITSDDHFQQWIHECVLAGSRTFGVRILMDNPQLAEGIKVTKAAVIQSLKRTNREFVGSDDAVGQDTGSEANQTSSANTLDADPDQALTSAIADIRQHLAGSGGTLGESPRWTDPTTPARIVTITPAHMRVWGQDIVAKVPGVSFVTPPVNRPEFRTARHMISAPSTSGPDAGVPLSGQSHVRGSLSGLTVEEVSSLAMQVPSTLAEFLAFAHIRDPAMLAMTTAQLTSIGLDDWFVFKNQECQSELGRVGMTYGTSLKLIMAAKPYEALLAGRALEARAQGPPLQGSAVPQLYNA